MAISIDPSGRLAPTAIYIYTTNDVVLEIQFQDEDGNVLNIDGWRVVWSAYSMTDDSEPVVSRDSNNGNTEVEIDGANGLAKVKINRTLFNDAAAAAEYRHRAKAKDAVGEEQTAVLGVLTVGKGLIPELA